MAYGKEAKTDPNLGVFSRWDKTGKNYKLKLGGVECKGQR